jgi:predicted DCC family thiol-disulfide oxidoreductase YuxK
VPWDQLAAAVRARVTERPERLVLYDGGCGLSTGSIAVLARLDLLRCLQFEDIATEWGRLSHRHPALDRNACLGELHVIDRQGEVLRGFDAYRSIAWVVPLGWLVLPCLYLPGVSAIGQRVYRAVAARRSTTTRLLPEAAGASPTASRRTN